MATASRELKESIGADTAKPSRARVSEGTVRTSAVTSLVDPSPFSRRRAINVDSPSYRERVAMAAYYRAESRGFAPGHELSDWLEAEREVAAQGD